MPFFVPFGSENAENYEFNESTDKMKTLFKLSTLIMLFMCTLGFSSCGDDDNPEAEDLNLAQKVVGTYIGPGKVTFMGIEVETFSGMKAVITRSSNDYVLVDFRFANNESMFDESEVFQVLQMGNKGYMLRSESLSGIQFTISEQKKIEYVNPYLSINGESGYTFSFSGTIE